MRKHIYNLVNAVTLYRLLAAPVLLYLLINHRIDIFKWLLPLSFLSDAVDGYLSRTYKVTSIMGAQLDSIADELTVIVAVAGLFWYRPGFVLEQFTVIIAVLVLYVVQTGLALKRYGKISSFHTYLAKAAAVLQAIFLVLVFFAKPVLPLFYAVAVLTVLELLEEVMLVFLLPQWRANVKGLYWVLKKKATRMH